MTRTLAISALPGELRAAWLTDGALSDLAIRRDDAPAYADNLYLGRVAGLDRALGAAFVEIGLDRPGFLPLAEAPKGLSTGDRVVVRVKREPGHGPAESKGARLTAWRGALPEPLATAAARAKPPSLLQDAGDPLAALRDAPEPPEEIVIDDEACYAQARRTLAERPALKDRLRLDLDPRPLFERLGLEAEIDALLEPEVALPSGGALLFEPVRTLTAIDVNAGRHGGGGAGGQALAVNLEAASVIPRQIRLRNLSGLLVVDFLALGDPAARRRVTEALRDGVRGDPNPTRIQAMRPSGLLEMTRRRAQPPLHEVLSEPCGRCATGRVVSGETLAFQALRQVRAQVAGRSPRRLGLQVAPAVATALEGPCKAARAALEARLGRALEIGIEPGEARFRIVLD